MARYKALTGISIRKSRDPNSPDYETFIDFEVNDVLETDKVPEHTDWGFLIGAGHVEQLPEKVKRANG